MANRKALILAGGRGARLAPITDDIPKPLVPVANVPVIARAVDKIKREKICEAAITLGYGAAAVRDYFAFEGTRGVNISFYEEAFPLGTAGSALAARDFFDDDFVLLGGDTLFDFDISAAFEFHKSVGAVATLLLSRCDEPCRYGTAVCDDGGKIISFCEKPEWRRVRSDKISTGIYILSPKIFDRIPKGEFCDFAKDIFPSLIGDALYAYLADGYFCDIGTPSSYLDANIVAVNGDKGEATTESAVSPAANVAPTAKIERSVVMDGAKIGDGARVIDSVVCRGAVMMKNSEAIRAVVAPHAVLAEGQAATENVDIAQNLSFERAKRAESELSRFAAAESAGELIPDGDGYTVRGKAFAPHGSARTLGEIIERGASVCEDGAHLVFDGGAVTVSCFDAHTLDITARSKDARFAERLYEYAKDGAKNLF